jgi:DNA polymerase-3 subunit epsilon
LIIGILDLETTGKFTPEGRIIELSLRLCKLETGEEVENYVGRYNPERNIEAKAVQIHGITNEEAKKEPLFIDKIGEVKELLGRCDYVVAHNLDGFDYPYLEQEFQRCGEELPEFKTFDTLVHGTGATDLGKSPSLSELCFALDVVYDPTRAHRGDYDTEVLRDCFFNGVRFGWFILK